MRSELTMPNSLSSEHEMHTTWIDKCMKGLRFAGVSGLAIRRVNR